MKITCTGGTGFLGEHVTECFQEDGHEVVALGRGDYDLRLLDETLLMVEESKPDLVIHLAALCGGIGANVERPGDFWRENLMMGVNVLEACRLFDTKLLIAGTTCSYPIHAPVPFQEEALFDGYPEPTNAPYGIAKRSLIVGGNAYRDQYGLDVRFLLPTNLYGPYDSLHLKTNHVIPALILKFIQAKATNEKEVELWGTGEPTRDFLFAPDAAEAFLLAAKSMFTDSDWSMLNIGTGKEVSIAELAMEIKLAVGYEGHVQWNGKLGGQPRRALDCSAAKADLKWEAKTTLNKGLRITIAWIKEQLVGVS